MNLEVSKSTQSDQIKQVLWVQKEQLPKRLRELISIHSDDCIGHFGTFLNPLNHKKNVAGS